MSWIAIPNEIVHGFNGRPIRTQKMNDNLEFLFKPIRCPSCKYTSDIFTEWQDHQRSEHYEEPNSEVPIEPELKDCNAAWIILETLLTFNRQDSQQRPNILRRIQKPNDSRHTEELWRRAWNSRERTDIKVKKEQYVWLHEFLDRKVPLSGTTQEVKEKKDQGEEPQTVGMLLFSLSEDSVNQALTTLPERRIKETDELDEELGTKETQPATEVSNMAKDGVQSVKVS